MTKRPRPSLQGIIQAKPPDHISKQLPDKVIEQLRDDDVPAVLPDTAPGPEATETKRTKGRNAGNELKDYAHRSLYARPETLELIRELAFKDRTSAQALYREGLFLMLRKRGQFLDKTVDDV